MTALEPTPPPGAATLPKREGEELFLRPLPFREGEQA